MPSKSSAAPATTDSRSETPEKLAIASKIVGDSRAIGRGDSVLGNERVPAAALLETWADDPWTNGVQVDRMDDMGKLVVRTRNTAYEIIVIDGASGEILIRGGRFFPELTPARLAGATLGGSFCKMRGIYPGFCMEINVDDRRTVTSPVESVEHS